VTRAITIIAMTCFLVLGAIVTSILGRDGVPAASAEIAAASVQRDAVPYRVGKGDKLGMAEVALASFAPEPAPDASEVLRQAYAAASPKDIEASKPATQHAAVAPAAEAPVVTAAKPKPKPPVQKSYSLLSDAQIAGIKERLKLSSSQEYYWPGVETALRGIARKIHAARQGNPNAGAASLDPDSEEVQQLKSAAMPLLFQLRDDQKEEVRQLARLIGLEKVASAI
jgi:hypothetical protein